VSISGKKNEPGDRKKVQTRKEGGDKRGKECEGEVRGGHHAHFTRSRGTVGGNVKLRRNKRDTSGSNEKEDKKEREKEELTWGNNR